MSMIASFKRSKGEFWLTKISAHRLFPNFFHRSLMLFYTISSVYPFHAMDCYIPTIHLPHLHSNFFPPLTLLLAKNKVDSHLSRALGRSLECPCAPTCRPTYKLTFTLSHHHLYRQPFRINKN